jgi:hypothetical protein
MGAVAHVCNSLSHEHRNSNFFTQPLQISIKFGKVVGLVDTHKFRIFNPSILFVRGIQISQKKVTFWCNKACKNCYKSNPKYTVTPLKMEQTLVTETSEVKTQTPGNSQKNLH